MRKQLRQYFRKSLCGMLSAAMIMTGSIIPDISVLAAQPAVEDTAENNDADGQVDKTPSEENKDALQNPNAGNDNVDGNEGDVERNDSDGKDEEVDVTSPDENANPDDEENSDIKDGVKENDGDDDNVEEVPDGGIALIATSDKSYTDKSVTLNYYIEDLGDGETVGFCPWTNAGGAITVDENLELGWKAWTNKTVYEMKSVEGNKGWYNITFTVTDTLTIDSETNECSNSLAGFNILRSNEPDKKDGEFGCDAWHYPEIYVDLLAGTVTAVKDGKGYANIAAVDGTTGEVKYENQSVTLNYYVGELADDETVGFYKWGSSITVNETTNPKLSWGGWGKPSENPVYRMNAVDGHTGWYNITLTVSEKLTIDPDTGISTSSLGGFSIFISSSTETQQIECSGYPEKYPEIYKGLLDGEITAVKGGKGYASIEDAGISIKDLEALVVEAKELKEEDYKATGWKKFSKALEDAEAVLEKDNPTNDEIEEAYENLEEAMDALVPKSVAEAEINVKPIALADDFITGADISSYWALKESGTIFKDEKGNELSDAEFFQYLHDGGTNWIRIRVWNDPYDSAGHGYGGGNNDLDKAKKMGKLATDAGMKVLIDFHYSDFWADPGKQQAPKAWASMSVDDRAEAVYQFTKNSLDELKSAGVDVGMVQVGNETTQGICGVWYASDGWAAAAKIYNAGSKAIREFDPNCLVAIHFTNPEDSGKYAGLAKNLDDQKVDYDVFASSYYPYWHGTTDNLTSVLAQVAKTYGKKVMVAETSWATTLDDQDGHDNTVRKGNNDTGQPYAFSVQGQADEIRAVVEAANNVNNVEGAAGSSIGVFYWESAWLSPYYAYDEDGSRNEELYNKNMAAWEQYGSGWAASYGGEYDPKDAGKWYGGSAVDNQAWFGFDGTALATAKVYSYIRTGATAEKAISDVVNPSVTVKAGATVEYPETVTVNFNDGTSAECPVEWNGEDKAEVDTNEPGDHTVRGIVTCEYTVSDGSTKTATKSVTLTITVEMTSVEGLANPGFEDSVEGNWVLTEADIQAKDQRSGKQAAHFYSADGTTTKVLQTVKGLEAGIYIFGGYIEGADADADAVVTIYDKDGNIKGNVMKLSCSLDGWLNWKNPEITGIVISEGDYLVVGMEVAVKAGGWGSMDDFYLYRAYEYDIRVDDQIKHGTLSCSAEKSVSGEAITVTATPDDGYILSKLTVFGRGVTGATLTSEHGNVIYDAKTKAVILSYDDIVTEKTEESFIMPNSKVTVSAVFRTNVDLAGLNKVIEEYKSVTYDGYTEESWKAFTDALEAAKKAAENLEATQTEIDSAREALEAAYDGLEKSPLATQEEIAALKSLIEEYGKLTSEGYTEESWKNFTEALAAAKTAVGKEGVTTADISRAKGALEKAHEELKKTSTGVADLTALNALIAKYDSVTNDGYTEESWNVFAAALAAAKEAAKKENVTQTEVDSAKAALETAYAGLVKAANPVRTGLWAEWTDEWAELLSNGNTITYTGKAIKPTVKVYDGETLLTNKSYSVSYQNNTKAGGEAGVIIKGKGNYTGSCTMKFNIAYVDLANDSDVSIANLYVAASKNGNPVSVKPVVTWKGKKVNAKLYDVILPDKSEGAYVTPGTYNVEVRAKENNGIYKGSRAIKITLVDTSNDTQVLMSAVKVKFNFKSKQWTDKAGNVTLDPNDIKVTYKKKDLEPDKDYELEYENNDQIGTATVIIKGTGEKFVGELRKTFKITGTAIKAADVKLNIVEPIVYNGTDHKPAVQIVGLTENKDYKVTYQNNRNAGKKATAIITGINGYSGTIKKTFTIEAHDVNDADNVSIVVNESVAYEKGGSKPPVEVTFGGRTLVPGTDYTVSYAKNTKVTEGATAEVRITGKGNFTKKKTVTFAIGKQSLGKLTATAADQISATKWNKVSPVITDLNGKVLKKGTDYEKTFTYKLYNTDGTEVTDTTATPPAVGMRVEVTATGKGSYEGMITAEYRIIDSKQSIAKARITVTPQTYTGKAIELSKDAIKLELKDGSDWKLISAEHYEIVGYSNNINKGKAAKVTIHGLAPYGGTKTFTFEIKAQSIEGMSLAERIASMFEMMFN